jgi:hypothetical protein
MPQRSFRVGLPSILGHIELDHIANSYLFRKRQIELENGIRVWAAVAETGHPTDFPSLSISLRYIRNPRHHSRALDYPFACVPDHELCHVGLLFRRLLRAIPLVEPSTKGEYDHS